jgi:hypothetical protein
VELLPLQKSFKIQYRQIEESKIIFSSLLEILIQRKHYLENVETAHHLTCLCVSKWPDRDETSINLCNQLLEQHMVNESSEALKKSLNPAEWVLDNMISDEKLLTELARARSSIDEEDIYQPQLPSPSPPKISSSKIKLISGRYEMAERLNQLAEASSTVIEFAFCYLFFNDHLVRAMLLETLIGAARRGVQVKLMLDGETAASASLRSILHIDATLADVQRREVDTRNRGKSEPKALLRAVSGRENRSSSSATMLNLTTAAETKVSGVDEASSAARNQFFGVDTFRAATTKEKLSSNMQSKWNASASQFEWTANQSYSSFIESLYDAAAAPEFNGNFQIRFYTQKDSVLGYSIKAHSKMYCFDRQVLSIYLIYLSHLSHQSIYLYIYQSTYLGRNYWRQ